MILLPIVSKANLPDKIITATNVNAQKELSKLEASSGGKLGIFAINTGNNQIVEYNSEKRFPMGSTAKVIGVLAILKKSMINNNLLEQKVIYSKEEVVSSGYAPETAKHLSDGMTIAELCKATITQSDNAAFNLLVKKLGGPQAVTAFAKSVGDNTFRLDRFEPELNSATPGDIRDTTTPKAIGKSLQKLVFGNVLAEPQRRLLQKWLIASTTGNFRIRAGVPKGWLVGDKTGTSDYGTTNDIGIIWPPKCLPIIVSIYFTQNKKAATPREDVIASAARILMRHMKLKQNYCMY